VSVPASPVTRTFDGSGSHFDPDVVEAFKATEQEIRGVATKLRDG